MKKKSGKYLLFAGLLVVALGACSSDDSSESDVVEEEAVAEEATPAEVGVTTGRFTLDQSVGAVGVVSADNSQSGLEVDFSVFNGKNIGIVAVLPVPEVTIQTDACQAIISANGGTSDFVNVDGDPNKAVQTFESFIARGDAGLWNVSNGGEALRSVIDAANAKGIPFIGSYAGNELGSADIREDEWATTPIIAQYIGNQLNGEGTVAILGSNAIYTLLQRTTILESVLAFEFPKIKVVRLPDFDFTPEGARAIAEAALQADPSIKAIFSHWDVPASGAIQAASDLGRDDLIITSYTGDNKSGYEFIEAGVLAATVGQSNRQVGVLACEYLALALAGQALPEDTLVPTGFVTKANNPGTAGVFNARPYVLNPTTISYKK
jgi:ribose transport system substrate-binding protein